MVTGPLFDSALPDGLMLEPEFLSGAEAAALLSEIDRCEWESALQRRTQQFGSRYDHATGRVGLPGSAPPLPRFLVDIGSRLEDSSLLSATADQVIVNEYLGGDKPQGIAQHSDHPRDFGPEIVTISLVEPWVMRFTHREESPIDLLLPVGSALAMTGAARYDWCHGIQPRRYDRVNGTRQARHRRVSATFRRLAS